MKKVMEKPQEHNIHDYPVSTKTNGKNSYGKTIRFDKNSNSTGWILGKLNRKELERLNITQLIILARRKRGLKKILIDFYMNFKLD